MFFNTIPDIGGALGVGKTFVGLASITDFALMFLLNGFIVRVVVATIWVEAVVVATCKLIIKCKREYKGSVFKMNLN